MKYLIKMIDVLLVISLFAFASVAVPVLLGFHVYTVISPSMAPALAVGSAVYVKEKEFEQIREGDIITYSLGKAGLPVTHRVVKKTEASRTFLTKGDANEQADGRAVDYGDLIGVVRFSVPLMGYLDVLLGNAGGKILIAGMWIWLLWTRGILLDITAMEAKGVNAV